MPNTDYACVARKDVAAVHERFCTPLVCQMSDMPRKFASIVVITLASSFAQNRCGTDVQDGMGTFDPELTIEMNRLRRPCPLRGVIYYDYAAD